MSQPLLTFVHISDTHISPDPDYGLDEWRHTTHDGAEALVHHVNALSFPVDFVLHTGDVIYNPDAQAYHTARAMLGQINYPVYYAAGNHDDPVALQRILLGRSDILSSFHYEFEVNGVQIIVLDSNGPVEPPHGIIVPEQMAWLRGLCSKADARPLVVAVHHNALPVGSPWLDDSMRITNGEALHETLLLAKNRLRGVFFGHVHQSISMYRDGILYTSGLSSWSQLHGWLGLTETVRDEGAECGFNVVTLTDDGTTYVRRWRFRVE
jgi:3',5'-cyclic-AMP phosphodiesterase